MSGENLVCGACITEAHLSAEINTNGALDKCYYCNKRRPTIPIDQVAERTEWVIETYYRCTDEDDRVVLHNYSAAGQSIEELVEELIPADDQIRVDLIDALSERWFDYDSHQSKYGEEPHFERSQASALSSTYSRKWRQMEVSLRQEARHFNPLAIFTLEQVFGPLMGDRTVLGQQVIVDIGPKTQLTSLYRCRVFQTLESLESALENPAKAIGPPPTEVARHGRMNAKGVSVFYGSTKSEMALAEVRPPVGSFVVSGKFEVIRPLRVLDLVQLEQTTSTSSLFAPSTLDEIERHQFLKALAKRMVAPVMPDQEDGGYLITQVIADFLATHEHLNLDGIMFSSVQYKHGDSHDRNVTLFHKASRVGESNISVKFVQLFDTDEDGEHWDPLLTLQDFHSLAPNGKNIRPTRRDEIDRRAASLDLDLNAIEIYEVEGAAYDAPATKVQTWLPAQTVP